MADGLLLSDDMIFDWLALERVPKVGPLTVARLYDAFGSPRAALNARADEIRKRAGIREGVARTIAEFVPPEKEIRKDIALLNQLGVRVMTRWDPDYPPMLKEIYDPPALLFVRGTIAAEDSRAVAMVGTRNPSTYGLEIAERLSRDLLRAGVTLVSGLARGIDTACHATAVRESGRTLGVLGCGIDVVYPRDNKDLIEEVTRCGAVITEFRPGTRPLGTNFFRRNRIVSGLSRGVIVVECTDKSGSLITAGHAVDQNRDVFAVPGNIMNIRSRGPHKLIRQGAALIESAEDVLQELFPQKRELPPQATLFDGESLGRDLSETARTVLEQIDLDPVPIDGLCQSLQMDVGKLAGILLELELKGLIKQHPGKTFSRTSG